MPSLSAIFPFLVLFGFIFEFHAYAFPPRRHQQRIAPSVFPYSRAFSQQQRAMGEENNDLSSLSVKELKALARERTISTDDCFDRESLVLRLSQPAPAEPSSPSDDDATTPCSASADSSINNNDTADEDEALAAALEELRPLSIRELKTIIFRANLSSRGLLEKGEILAQAARGKVLLDNAPLPDDARAFIDDGVLFFGRLSCPYCVDALKVIEARGITEEKLKGDVMKDVERNPSAASEMQRLRSSESGSGGGVPYFYSPKTGKSAAGWVPGAEDLGWLMQKLR
jgi:hypothetical protein